MGVFFSHSLASWKFEITNESEQNRPFGRIETLLVLSYALADFHSLV
jgi:hypothetical protein